MGEVVTFALTVLPAIIEAIVKYLATAGTPFSLLRSRQKMPEDEHQYQGGTLHDASKLNMEWYTWRELIPFENPI